MSGTGVSFVIVLFMLILVLLDLQLDVSDVSSEAQGDQQQQQAKFFHKISILALASYCNSRNLLPKECIRFKEVYGLLSICIYLIIYS